MRRKIFCLATLFAIILAPSAVKADLGFLGDGCYYVGALGGANWLTQSHRQCCFRPKYETGYAVGGFVGYKMCCYNFRGEIEFTYRRNQIEHRKHKRRHFIVDGISESGSSHRRHRDRGHFRDFSLMFNGFYDIDLCSCFTPYVGAGVGVDWTRFENNRRRRRHDDSGSGSGSSFDGSIISGGSSGSGSCRRGSGSGHRRRHHCKDKTRVALQAIAGVSYNICNNIDVSVDYRYHWTERFFNNHLVALGLRYYF